MRLPTESRRSGSFTALQPHTAFGSSRSDRSRRRRIGVLLAVPLAVGLTLHPAVVLAAGSEDAPPTTRAGEAPSGGSGQGSGSGSSSGSATTLAPSAGALYADGKAAISRKDWSAAITALKAAAKLEPNNADIHNLLGYSYRKSGDLKSAFAEYAVALKLNPKHKGALEYQGEAYVESGNLTKAKANLAKLKTVCGNTTCEEYKDLAAFINAASSKKPSTTKK